MVNLKINYRFVLFFSPLFLFCLIISTTIFSTKKEGISIGSLSSWYVTVDQSKKFALPYANNNLKIGLHSVSFFSSIDSSSTFYTFELTLQENELISFDLSSVGQKYFLEKKISSYYENLVNRLFFSLGLPRTVFISTEPQGVEVELDGKIVVSSPGSFPLTRNSTFLRLIKEGYLLSSLDLKNQDHLQSIDFSLVPDLFFNLRKVDSSNLENLNESDAALGIKKVSSWNKGGFSYNASELKFSRWQNILTFQISADSIDGQNVPSAVASYLDSFFSVSPPPFCYFLDSEGEVFEGFGIRDIDFSIFNNFYKKYPSFSQINKGDCPVLIVNGSLRSEKINKSLQELQAYLSGSSKQQLQINIVGLTPSILANQAKEVKISLENKGDAVFITQKDEVSLRSFPAGSSSSFYDPSSWLSRSEILSIPEGILLPLQKIELSAKVKAPLLLGNYNEMVALFDKKEDRYFDSTVINWSFLVDWSGPFLEIKDNEYGFANVRDKPEIQGNLLGTVFPGEKYIIADHKNDWYEIKLRDGGLGWINGQLISLGVNY